VFTISQLAISLAVLTTKGDVDSVALFAQYGASLSVKQHWTYPIELGKLSHSIRHKNK